MYVVTITAKLMIAAGFLYNLALPLLNARHSAPNFAICLLLGIHLFVSIKAARYSNLFRYYLIAACFLMIIGFTIMTVTQPANTTPTENFYFLTLITILFKTCEAVVLIFFYQKRISRQRVPYIG